MTTTPAAPRLAPSGRSARPGRSGPAALLGVALVGLLAACSGPTGRIKDPGEADLVGNQAAGAAAYTRVVEEGVTELLQSHSAHAGPMKATLACLGFENRGIEELGDWDEQLYELIDTAINRSGAYRTVSRLYVDAGLSESALRQDDLFIPKHQRTFVSVMETQGNPVQLLLFPKLTTGTTRSGDVSQRDYLLTLELVEVATGWNDKFSGTVRKEYER